MSDASRHDTDFYAWTREQADLLRTGRLAEADIANIAEEIESMGRSEKRELVNRLAALLAYLLKWQVQPALRGNSWRLTIREQRAQLSELLKDNPSLAPLLPEALATAYRFALLTAQRETGLSETAFPAASLWTIEEAMAAGFLPEEAPASDG